jgi:hypothetical protein
MDRNEILFARAQAVIPGGVNSPVRAFRAVGGTPRFIRRAEGAYLWDENGRRYIDYIGSWGPMILGHGHPAVVEAVQRALRDGFSFGAPTEREIELAEAICAHLPAVEQLRLVSSGTEAGMSCIRLARGFTGRTLFVKFEGCYHGHADALLVKAGSGLATFGHPTSAGVPDEVAQHTLVLPYNDVEALEACFARHADQLAAVMLEPIAGNMNFVRASLPFMRRLRELCSQHGALLIIDEVMTGFRVALGRRAKPVRGADPRFLRRPDGAGQGDRRRHAAGGLRRAPRGDGQAGTAGRRLPGRHAERQPGGHRLRSGHAARDREAGLLRRPGRTHGPARRRPEQRGTRVRPALLRRQPGRQCSASSCCPNCRRTTSR